MGRFSINYRALCVTLAVLAGVVGGILIYYYWNRPRDKWRNGTVIRKNIPLAFRKRMNLLTRGKFTRDVSKVEIPPGFSWWEKLPRWIQPPLNQEDCGSCWAFAIASTITDRAIVDQFTHPELLPDDEEVHFVTSVDFRGKKIKNQFSPYILASCDFCEQLKKQDIPGLMLNGEKCNLQCDGGVLEWAYIFLDDNGLITMYCNIQTRGEYKCQDLNKIKGSVVGNRFCHLWQFDKPIQVSRYEPEELKDEARKAENIKGIQVEIYENGPVTAGMVVFQSFYDFFSDKKNAEEVYIYTGDPGDKELGGHAIEILGWGDRKGEKYWWCKNSWGEEWADGGYFKIKMGTCSIEEDVWANKLNWAESLKQRTSENPILALQNVKIKDIHTLTDITPSATSVPKDYQDEAQQEHQGIFF